MENNPPQNLIDVAGQKFGELNSAEKTLFTLAQEKFQELRDSEYKLFRAIANSETADYRTGVEAEDQPEHSSNWGEERTLRGDRIRWLCITPEVWKLCLPEGMDILGAKLEGALNLSFSNVEIPLQFSYCYFAEALRLRQAKLRRLDLSGTYIASSALSPYFDAPPIPTAIDAREISVTGSVFLRNNFQAMGQVSLAGASIGGNFVCEKGMFTNETGDALFAQSANVKGSVFLSNEFQAKGRVSLSGATIGGVLDCNKGTFSNEGKDALVAENLNLTGSFFLCNGFQAVGRVNLYGATIGSNLDCNQGRLINKEGEALIATNVNVKGSVFLCNGFQAVGMVSLLNANIGGNLECPSESLQIKILMGKEKRCLQQTSMLRITSF